ncbi:MAG: hypothetical protein AB1609_00760 [Bacillota bacterium]
MPEVEFRSAYKGIAYKVPGTDKVARFQNGKLVTEDKQVIACLRKHDDYGTTLTEVGKAKGALTPGVVFCPVEDCKKVFKTEQELADHLAAEHPDHSPAK